MRTIDFAPLYRSTVGFDQLFEMLDSSARPDWPPYDIERLSEDRYRITMAVAGFGRGDIELTQQGNTLLIAGEKKADKEERQLLYKGIADRSFRQTFNLADYMRVADASLQDGLLAIDVVREVPEQLKPRRIEIGSASGRPVETKQIDQQPKAA
ncbi:MAG TPA: Hsp20 family protein [Devosiaceae bacterium]|nr:Hsp20 family protein [Devosiaceae bacterium]